MITERDETLIETYEARIVAYADCGYRCEYDIFFMKHFYRHFKFMNLSKFVEAMRFLTKVS